ncbi:protein of unknown function [Methylacidimicrobium sp. AP8]|nr:protein of unknown function [Methylacidimicrobium sp. AP8]
MRMNLRIEAVRVGAGLIDWHIA